MNLPLRSEGEKGENKTGANFPCIQSVLAKLFYKLLDIRSSNGQSITGPDHFLLDWTIYYDFLKTVLAKH